jgi:hypothetical protein
MRPAAGQGGFASIPAPVAAREDLWLGKARQGWKISEIARRVGLGPRRILHGIARAREREENSRKRESRLQGAMQGEEPPVIVNSGGNAGDDPRRPPRLVPLFPIGPFTPRSACPHRGRIRPGSVFCCMVCSQSGMDDHPALRRDPLTDPRSERRRTALQKGRASPLTRKERRRRLYAAQDTAPAASGGPDRSAVADRSGPPSLGSN